MFISLSSEIFVVPLRYNIKRIAKTEALERYFRPEGRMNDSVVALPVASSSVSRLLRLVRIGYE